LLLGGLSIVIVVICGHGYDRVTDICLRPGKCFTRAPRCAPNVPGGTLGGIWWVRFGDYAIILVILLPGFRNALGCVFIELRRCGGNSHDPTIPVEGEWELFWRHLPSTAITTSVFHVVLTVGKWSWGTWGHVRILVGNEMAWM
jgi:hypothetical protein